MKTYIGISRDHSASMGHLTGAARTDYNDTIDAIKKSSIDAGDDTFVSVVKCGVGRAGGIEVETRHAPVSSIQHISSYVADGRRTPLFDSVGELIDMLESLPASQGPSLIFEKNGKKYTAAEITELVEKNGKAGTGRIVGAHPDTIRSWVKKIGARGPGDSSELPTYLVMAITDGEDNASKKYPIKALSERMLKLIATDRWTFVFRVPAGHYKKRLVGWGIPEGNILEWELTERGVREATTITASAFDAFYTSKKSGLRSTKTFYASADTKPVRDILSDVTKHVNIKVVDGVHTVSSFSERVLKRPLKKGTIFYQLVKRESAVQDYKHIFIRDKRTGLVYGGREARDIIGIPSVGTHPVAPGDHSKYDIFIQSTSATRRLPEKSLVLFWDMP